MHSGTFPQVIVDGAKRVVEIKRRPNRIVSLSPGTTELLFAIGAGPRVVAVTEWCNFPPEATSLPRVGDMNTNLEAVAILEADLVVGDEALQQTTAERLANLGLPVFLVKPKSIGGILDSCELLGRATGCLTEAQDLVNDLTMLLSAVRQKVSTGPLAANPVSVLVLFGTAELYTAGQGTYLDEAITRAGGANIAAHVRGAWPQLSAEYVVARDPEVILLTYGTSAELAKNPQLGRLTAVTEGRVYPIDPDVYSRPTDRLIKGILPLADLFVRARG